MKKLGMLGIIGGAALLTAAPFSLQWPQENVALSINSAEARIAGGVHRRVYRRTYRRAAYAARAAGVAGYGYGSYYGSSAPFYSSYPPQPYWSYYRPVSSYVVRSIDYPYPPPRDSYSDSPGAC